MKLILSTLLAVSMLLIVGASQAHAEILDIQTDLPEYRIGDNVKITVIVDDYEFYKDKVINIKILNEYDNFVAIVNIDEHGGAFEGIFEHNKMDLIDHSLKHTMYAVYDEQEFPKQLTFVNEESTNPNRPIFTNHVELDPIFNTACLAEGDVLDENGVCVSTIPHEESIEILSTEEYDLLKQENEELRQENAKLREQIDKMTEEFRETLKILREWFTSKLNN